MSRFGNSKPLINQPKGDVDMAFISHNAHSSITAAISMQTPSLIIQHSEPSFGFQCTPNKKHWTKSISQDYNLRHFLAFRVINRLFSLPYVTRANGTVRRWKLRRLSVVRLYEKCLTEWKDGWWRDWSEIRQWAEVSPEMEHSGCHLTELPAG